MINYDERRPAVNCNGPYEVNRRGEIFNIKTGMKIKPQMSKKGYLRFTDHCKGIIKTRTVHRTTLLTYVPNEHNLPQINHINGDKTDNRVENLEWCDNGHNQRHAYRVLGKVHSRPMLGKPGARLGKPKPEGAGRPLRPVRGVHKQIGEVLEFVSIIVAARQVGGNPAHIVATCQGKRKSCAGYRWEYI